MGRGGLRPEWEKKALKKCQFVSDRERSVKIILLDQSYTYAEISKGYSDNVVHSFRCAHPLPPNEHSNLLDPADNTFCPSNSNTLSLLILWRNGPQTGGGNTLPQSP